MIPSRLRTIIVDDEAPGSLNLQRMIETYCPHLEVTGVFDSARKARQFLEREAADAVFLDICMPNENGFDFISSFEEPPFAIVFVTAHQEYALRAIRASAVDYLLKPILPEDLQRAQERLLRMCNTPAASMQALSENLPADSPKKLVVYHSKGFNIIETGHIIYLEADGNYTTFHLHNARPLLVSRPIREFEAIFDPRRFVRIHKSHLINLEYLEQYVSKDASYVLLTGGYHVEVSRRRAPLLFSRLTEFTGLRKNYKR